MWTNISKPGAQSYTKLSKPSNPSYTNIPKPTGSVIGQIKAGMITGLMIPLTYATTHTFTGSLWVNINKPN